MTAVASSATLTARIAAVACCTGKFYRPDGQSLDGYFDEYLLASDPCLLAETAAALAGLIPPGTGAVAGLELGGIPIVAALSAATALPALFVRKTPKTYGTLRQVEGPPASTTALDLRVGVIGAGERVLGEFGWPDAAEGAWCAPVGGSGPTPLPRARLGVVGRGHCGMRAR